MEEVRQQAQMWAIVAEMNAIMARIDGMKAANMVEFTYNEQAFLVCQQELEVIATKFRDVANSSGS